MKWMDLVAVARNPVSQSLVGCVEGLKWNWKEVSEHSQVTSCYTQHSHCVTLACLPVLLVR